MNGAIYKRTSNLNISSDSNTWENSYQMLIQQIGLSVNLIVKTRFCTAFVEIHLSFEAHSSSYLSIVLDHNLVTCRSKWLANNSATVSHGENLSI